MMDALLNLTAQMAREGIRRLLVLSGDESWTLQQAQALRRGSAAMACGLAPSRFLRPAWRPAR